MPLNKQALDISFAQGLDQKTDPFRVQAGKFQKLQNSVFKKGGQLTKRNGYGVLASLFSAQPASPSVTASPSSYITTLNNNLTLVGNSIQAYNEGNKTWITKGSITPQSISTSPLIRNNLNQTQCDAALAPNGLLCTVYTELNNATSTMKYAVSDSVTGQNIVAPTALVNATGSPRVFLLGNNFIIGYTATNNLNYIAVNVSDPTIVTSPVTIDAYTPSSGLNWDAVFVGNQLFIAYFTTAGGDSVKIKTLSLGLVLSSAITKVTGAVAATTTITIDNSTPNNPLIWILQTVSGSRIVAYFVLDRYGNTVLTTHTANLGPFGSSLVSITGLAQNGICTVFAEVANNYSYDSGIPSHYIYSAGLTQAGGFNPAPYNVIRSVGLASKVFQTNNTFYFMAAYQSPFQNTYFMVNGSLSTADAPVICSKLAYENGGGYLTLGLPSAQVIANTVTFPYLFKDLVEALNTINNSQQTTAGGIYSQTGINLATIAFTSLDIDTAEIAKTLHLSGGFLGMYDGYLPVEQNFFLWPDSVEVTGSTSSGLMTAQQYFYQAVYEWSDNNGNIYRSAPSIPVTVTTTGSTSSVTVNVPTIRLTMKTNNPVKIVIYRWSTANQTYYQVTSITAPTLNSTTTDSIAYVDTLADSSIIGNNIIYTTGGVVEDVNGPATNIMTLFDTRLWLVDAEDPNLLWYSKQVIEATPVEMSDLFTLYIAPNTGTASSTGPITALAPMDDKLIIFKKDAIYYINGSGPDNTGANSQYSQPVFITSTVGCNNQQSAVLTPTGLMFQSDKGIWLLDRSLNSSYIGAPVNDFNDSSVNSAVNVPGTNQIRFTLDTGETLMYDYYYQQWGTFIGVPAVSSCLYQGLHTYINSYGLAFQETPGAYLDGSNPVLLSFTTSWLNMAGLQGYERAFYFYLLGVYLSPHKLQMQIAYDYNSSPVQSDIITPVNFSSSVPSPFGDTPAPFGSMSNIEQWKIHMKRQKCQSFQITLNEVFDPSLGTIAGAGLTLSGINLVVGAKKGWKPIRASNTIG